MDRAKYRNNKIDILRCIGTLLVILAHMKPPELLLNIRTFDVVVLVMISGMAFSYNPPSSPAKYILKRLKRLLLPTYIIITLIFIISFFMCSIMNKSQLYDASTIIQSYLFLNGIGYIWIIKVYLMIAIAAPLLYKAVCKIHNDWQFIGLVAASYGIYAFLYWLLKNKGYVVLDYYVYYAIPYSLVALLGMRSAKDESFLNKLLPTVMVCFVLTQSVSLFNGRGFCPDIDKYPPGVYYLTYGLLVCAALYKLLPSKTHCIIQWGSRNSLTVYLVHIIVLMGVNMTADLLSLEWLENWLLKYVIVIMASVFISMTIEYVKLRSIAMAGSMASAKMPK